MMITKSYIDDLARIASSAPVDPREPLIRGLSAHFGLLQEQVAETASGKLAALANDAAMPAALRARAEEALGQVAARHRPTP